jgi:hypothetical protein
VASKAIGTSGDGGLKKKAAPTRRRRNTAVADNSRRAAAPTARRTAGGKGSGAEMPAKAKRRAGMSAPAADDGSEVGRRVGHTTANQKRAAARPEKTRRDRPVDTAKPGVAADDRKAGYGHTARRNTKLNTRKATAMLEDSVQERPSRKSTRRASNRIKQATQLTSRVKRNVAKSPSARAFRAAAKAK